MNNVEKLLRAASDLITKPGSNCKKSFARDINGIKVQIESPEAVSFCAVGALYKAVDITKNYSAFNVARFLLSGAAKNIFGCGSYHANDMFSGAPDIYSEAIEAASELNL